MGYVTTPQQSYRGVQFVHPRRHAGAVLTLHLAKHAHKQRTQARRHGNIRDRTLLSSQVGRVLQTHLQLTEQLHDVSTRLLLSLARHCCVHLTSMLTVSWERSPLASHTSTETGTSRVLQNSSHYSRQENKSASYLLHAFLLLLVQQTIQLRI